MTPVNHRMRARRNSIRRLWWSGWPIAGIASSLELRIGEVEDALFTRVAA